MRRTLTIFLVLVALVFAFDYVSRHVLGLDCIGPVLPVWGCLAAPYPTTLGSVGDFSGSILTYAGLILGGLVVAYLVRNLVFTVGGYLLHRFRPDMVDKLSGEEPRSYRIR